jgi:tetratricopeptide (TPR) repeat protein
MIRRAVPMGARPPNPRLRAAVLLGALAAGCAPERGAAYDAAFAAGERAFHSGRWAEAATAWDGAAVQARRVKDRDEARFLEARAFERDERWAEARAVYRKLAADSPSGPRTARAFFDLASIEIAHGDVAGGWRMLDEAARRFPAHGLARPAIRRLVQHAGDTGGEPAVLTFLDAIEAAFRGTEQEEVIPYERGLSLERAGRRREAHDVLLASARRHSYDTGGLNDDSFWRAAAIDDEDGRFDEAIAHLRELLSSREPSGAWPDYERPRYSRALRRIAEIYRDGLHDHAAARRAFEDVYALHAATLKRDEAVWDEARLALEDGDHATACSLAKRLLGEFPESRYAPCAHDLCPGAQHTKSTKRECADYILRQLHEPGEPSAGGLGAEPPSGAPER